MGRQQETGLAGEVTCLNCGAVLAEVVRGNDAGVLGLRRARFQTAVQVEIVGPHSLRCQRCNGRALVALFDNPTEEFQAEARGKHYTLA
jgi:hypothetical protein